MVKSTSYVVRMILWGSATNNLVILQTEKRVNTKFTGDIGVVLTVGILTDMVMSGKQSTKGKVFLFRSKIFIVQIGAIL